MGSKGGRMGWVRVAIKGLLLYTYIYRCSRLREDRTAKNIEKQKTRCPIFLDYLSFFVEEPPLYLLQGGRKLALIIIHIYISIYIRSRLRERQTASIIVKR